MMIQRGGEPGDEDVGCGNPEFSMNISYMNMNAPILLLYAMLTLALTWYCTLYPGTAVYVAISYLPGI